jgi:hypothetical protein
VLTEAKKVKRKGYPPIGTAMYCVREHLYREPGRAGPKMEYVAFCGEVVAYLYPVVQDVGEKVFYTAREAAELAQSMTEDYERRWAWTARWGDVPLRRPWKNLLD